MTFDNCDLFSGILCRFLRIDAVTRSPKTWYRLQHPNFAASFKDLFERVAIRYDYHLHENRIC